jgi:hypothetical protein
MHRSPARAFSAGYGCSPFFAGGAVFRCIGHLLGSAIFLAEESIRAAAPSVSEARAELRATTLCKTALLTKKDVSLKIAYCREGGTHAPPSHRRCTISRPITYALRKDINRSDGPI